MKNAQTKPLILGIILTLIAVIGLAGCGSTSTAPQDGAENANGGATDSAENTDGNSGAEGSPTGESAGNVIPSPVFRIAEDGELVKAPEGTTQREWRRVYSDAHGAGFEEPVATTQFVTESNNSYTVEIFDKQANESLLDWGRRTEQGDAFLSPTTVQTKNSKTGYVYTSGDEGSGPWHHVMVVTDEHVYRFESSDVSSRETPQHFLDFIKEVEVE